MTRLLVQPTLKTRFSAAIRLTKDDAGVGTYVRYGLTPAVCHDVIKTVGLIACKELDVCFVPKWEFSCPRIVPIMCKVGNVAVGS